MMCFLTREFDILVKIVFFIISTKAIDQPVLSFDFVGRNSFSYSDLLLLIVASCEPLRT